MSVKPARKLEIVQRRQRVAELYLQGWQQDAIAKELAIRQPMVSEDLAKIRQAWRESAIRDFDAARDLELARTASNVKRGPPGNARSSPANQRP